MTSEERQAFKAEIIKELIFDFLSRTLKKEMAFELSGEDINDLKAIAELLVIKTSDHNSRDNAIFELYIGIEERYDLHESPMQDAITEICYVFNLY